MTNDHHKTHFSDTQSAQGISSAALFFSVLLFVGSTNSHAQDKAKKAEWAINPDETEQVLDNTEAEPEPVGQSEANATRQDQVDLTREREQSDSTEEAADNPLESLAHDVEDLSLFQYDLSLAAEPIVIPIVAISPVATLSPQLRDSLESQFQAIQTLKETEDAFSEQLGESYLAYGRTLMQAGRIDEARKMLVNALHLAKINNGVNSIEQRPVLRELFELNLALENAEETEARLSRILWLEKKAADNNDLYSFDMVVRLGNLYLDLYLSRPIVNEPSMQLLNKSTRYFSYAINRYGDRPLSEILLPYGDFALAYHYQKRLEYDLNHLVYRERKERNFNSFGKLDESKRRRSAKKSFSRGNGFFQDYLRKAQEERDLVNTIQALLGLGDLSLMSGAMLKARRYYELAWSGAQNLPLTHSIVQGFDRPIKLPAFNSAIVRRPKPLTQVEMLIPVSIDIQSDGKVKKVAREALIATTGAITSRARRAAKRVRFRPVIENGKLISVNNYRYEVAVRVRKSKTVADKESAE